MVNDYADALARRNAELALPAPDGFEFCGAEAWWRMSTGALMFVRNGLVYSSVYDPRSVDALQQDALAVLAACAWARKC